MALPIIISMEDRELKKLLLETCPVRPGQEARAWSVLREQLYGQPERSAWTWLRSPAWRTGIAALSLFVVVGVAADLIFAEQARALATADSQAPGIYATSFYSKSAQAQVVWLNGMEPATDRPTFDTTGAVPSSAENAPPAGDPNSL